MCTEFLQLKQGFLRGLVGRQERLLEAWLQLKQASLEQDALWQQKALQALHKEAHNLAGAAGAYGLESLSQQARAAERLIWALLPSMAASQALEWQELHWVFTTLTALLEAEITSHT